MYLCYILTSTVQIKHVTKRLGTYDDLFHQRRQCLLPHRYGALQLRINPLTDPNHVQSRPAHPFVADFKLISIK